MSFHSPPGDSGSNRKIRYIYELPYHERKQLSQALDINNMWEELGGVYMKFDYHTMFKIGQAVMRNRSPTDELLDLWGSQNHTILELFNLLWKMKNYQAMKVLKPFVDEKYHYLIYEGESEVRFSGIDKNHSDRPTSYQRSSANREEAVESSTQKNITQDQQISPRRRSSDEMQGPTARKISERNLEVCTIHIPYKELEAATNCWKSTMLGRGGFGVVYKGKWKYTDVAIKRLESQKANESASSGMEIQKQQLKELQYLNLCRHDNILPLYGYSIDGEKPCLIYQYMPNGSLEDRIQRRQHTNPLPWLLRANIATGAARGLQYLHGMDKPLVHGDIKSANILLDQHFIPKIGDFGLAKEGPVQQYTHVQVDRIDGTRPYLPDEFLRGKKLSTRVDTYSFGVVLFELATGLKAYDSSRENKYLRDHVHNYEDNILKLIDSKVGPDEYNFYGPLIDLGKKCSSDLPKDRPSMVDVLDRLDQLLTDRKAAAVPKGLGSFRVTNPSNLVETQLPYDPATRKPSIALPSGSYQYAQWLYPSPAQSKQPFILSTSPTHPYASQPFHLLPQVPETSTGNKRVPFENIPHVQAHEQLLPNETNMAVSPSKQLPENRIVSPEIKVESLYSTTEEISEIDTSSESSVEQKSRATLDDVNKSLEDTTNVSLPNLSILK